MEKNKLMMMIIIVLLVVMLATVIGVSFYVLSLVRGTLDPSTPVASPAVGKQLTQKEITKLSLGEAITTNLAKGEDGTSHMAKIGVSIGYDNTDKKGSPALATTLTANLQYARSIALSCIRNYTYDELTDAGGDAKLAMDIKNRLQEEFDTTLIVEVYFVEWLIP